MTPDVNARQWPLSIWLSVCTHIKFHLSKQESLYELVLDIMGKPSSLIVTHLALNSVYTLLSMPWIDIFRIESHPWYSLVMIASMSQNSHISMQRQLNKMSNVYQLDVGKQVCRTIKGSKLILIVIDKTIKHVVTS